MWLYESCSYIGMFGMVLEKLYIADLQKVSDFGDIRGYMTVVISLLRLYYRMFGMELEKLYIADLQKVTCWGCPWLYVRGYMTSVVILQDVWHGAGEAVHC